MVSAMHATVVVEHQPSRAAAHLEKLTITLSPAPSLDSEPWLPQTAPAKAGAGVRLPAFQNPDPAPARSQSQPSLTVRTQPQSINAPPLTAAEPRLKAQAGTNDADAVPRVVLSPPASKLRSGLRRNIMLVTIIAAWYTSNIGLVLTNRRARLTAQTAKLCAMGLRLAYEHGVRTNTHPLLGQDLVAHVLAPD